MIVNRLNLDSTHALKFRVQVSRITQTERIRVQVGRIPTQTERIRSSPQAPRLIGQAPKA